MRTNQGTGEFGKQTQTQIIETNQTQETAGTKSSDEDARSTTMQDNENPAARVGMLDNNENSSNNNSHNGHSA